MTEPTEPRVISVLRLAIEVFGLLMVVLIFLGPAFLGPPDHDAAMRTILCGIAFILFGRKV